MKNNENETKAILKVDSAGFAPAAFRILEIIRQANALLLSYEPFFR